MDSSQWGAVLDGWRDGRRRLELKTQDGSGGGGGNTPEDVIIESMSMTSLIPRCVKLWRNPALNGFDENNEVECERCVNGRGRYWQDACLYVPGYDLCVPDSIQARSGYTRLCPGQAWVYPTVSRPGLGVPYGCWCT